MCRNVSFYFLVLKMSAIFSNLCGFTYNVFSVHVNKSTTLSLDVLLLLSLFTLLGIFMNAFLMSLWSNSKRLFDINLTCLEPNWTLPYYLLLLTHVRSHCTWNTGFPDNFAVAVWSAGKLKYGHETQSIATN